MKTLGIIVLVAIAFAVMVVGALLGVLGYINEERKNTCGKCDFCDHDLDHCWMRGITVGREDKACVTFRKREYETEK